MIPCSRFISVFALFCVVVSRSEGQRSNVDFSGFGQNIEQNSRGIRATGGDFAATILAETNMNRAKHGAKPLVLDDKLSADCKAWAEKMANADKMEHSSGDYGENLFSSSGLLGPAEAAKQAVKSWYQEVKHYDHNNPVFSASTGHFTALVWKASTKLGVGMATNPTKKTTFVVARYVPPGNYAGQFKDNVGRGP